MERVKHKAKTATVIMMMAKYSVIPLVRTRGRDKSEAEKSEEGKQIGGSMQGRKQGWTEETTRAEGEAWLTLLEHRGQRKVLQGPHFGHFCSYSRESGLCLFPEHLPVWNRLGQKLFTFT